MIYLSKGIMPWKTDGTDVPVSHCGALHKLTGVQAELWIDGRLRVGSTQSSEQESELKALAGLGIAECCDDTGSSATYRLLTNCSICPVRVKRPFRLLDRTERRLWHWISGAGLRLTMAEMVLLTERSIKPTLKLLGEENRQALTELIYTADTIHDGILETVMEKSPERDRAVRSVLGLLRKEQIFLI